MGTNMVAQPFAPWQQALLSASIIQEEKIECQNTEII